MEIINKTKKNNLENVQIQFVKVVDIDIFSKNLEQTFKITNISFNVPNCHSEMVVFPMAKAIEMEQNQTLTEEQKYYLEGINTLIPNEKLSYYRLYKYIRRLEWRNKEKFKWYNLKQNQFISNINPDELNKNLFSQ